MDVGRVSLRFLQRIAIAPTLILSFSACKNDRVEAVAPPTGFQEISSECAADALANRFVVRWKDGTTTIEHARDREDFMARIMKPHEDQIQFAEHDYVVQLDAPRIVEPQSQTLADDWGQQIIEASNAWSKGVEGQNVIVAVVDSGVDITHPQIAPRLAVNPDEIVNGIDDDGNGLVDDVSGYDFHEEKAVVADGTGHGTHVAGVILADHNATPASGAAQIRGLAPAAQLLPLDFMNDDGAGSIGNAVRAIHYAVQRGAKVINASWGGSQCSESLRQALRELEDHHVLAFVAAGNSGLNLDFDPEYPAAFQSPAQITVAASSARDIMAGFSNYSYSLVHLAAPGVNIVSTLPNGKTGPLSGTSMATPFVSGAAALLWSYRPSATAAQIREALLKGVERHPSEPRGVLAVETGGRLNVRRALDELTRLIP